MNIKFTTRSFIRYWSNHLNVPRGHELRLQTAHYLRAERKAWRTLRPSKSFSKAYARLAVKNQTPFLPQGLMAG